MLRNIPLVCPILQLYELALIAWVVLSWIRAPYDTTAGKIYTALSKIIDPIVIPLRRVIRPIPLGGIQLDISVILIFIAINILC